MSTDLKEKLQNIQLEDRLKELYGSNPIGIHPPGPNRVNDSNVTILIKQWSHLSTYLSVSYREQWNTFSDIDKYKTLYNKFNELKSKIDKGCNMTKSNIKSTSPIEFLLKREFDFTSCDEETLSQIMDKLDNMRRDLKAAIELVKENKLDEQIGVVKAKLDGLNTEITKAKEELDALNEQKQQLRHTI